MKVITKSILVILTMILSLSAFAEKPKYTSKSAEVVGKYSASSSLNCIDYIDVCEVAEVINRNGKLVIRFGGEFDAKEIKLYATRSGVLVFSRDDFNDDCDDDGCAYVQKISGVIYPKEVDGEWLPRVKAKVTLQCVEDPFDETNSCDPDKEYLYVVRMERGLESGARADGLYLWDEGVLTKVEDLLEDGEADMNGYNGFCYVGEKEQIVESIKAWNQEGYFFSGGGGGHILREVGVTQHSIVLVLESEVVPGDFRGAVIKECI